jgi:hypothetical protein
MSATLMVPHTLTRTVASRFVSHQSTFGRPVKPAATSTFDGLWLSSSLSTSWRFSIREVATTTRFPLSSSSLENQLASESCTTARQSRQRAGEGGGRTI